MHRHQGLAHSHKGGGLRARGPGEILPQRHDREQTDDPGHDDDGLDEPAGDVAEGDPSFCRLTTGNSVTAVPMTAIARITSRARRRAPGC